MAIEITPPEWLRHPLRTTARAWLRFWRNLSQVQHDSHTPAGHLSGGPVVNQRYLDSIPFDGRPRRRHDDIGLHIQEFAGTGRLFLTRDGTPAEVTAIDYNDDLKPVRGFLYLRPGGGGPLLRYEADWFLGGGYHIKTHNWDLVSVETATVTHLLAADIRWPGSEKLPCPR